MTFSLSSGGETWRVAPMKFDQLSRWRLYRLEERWRPLASYATAEDAMAAVATGRTGVLPWDAIERSPAMITADQWHADPDDSTAIPKPVAMAVPSPALPSTRPEPATGNGAMSE
jgi:hypothetical protein